ncbi:unnamed protein product, partial [marine sediment metagenome]
MKIPQRFKIKKIENNTAQEIVVKNHYLHRKAPCSFAFGFFDTNDKNKLNQPNLIGVIMYGTPSSAPLRKGLCGIEEKDNVIELTRLWIKDGLPQNVESYLISNTLKKVNKEIIVSFAEVEQGHLGIVYQASNWIYTGLSAKRTNWVVEGMNKHCQTIADKYTSKELKEKFGEKFKTTNRPRKHRYVYFNCDKRRKKE